MANQMSNSSLGRIVTQSLSGSQLGNSSKVVFIITYLPNRSKIFHMGSQADNLSQPPPFRQAQRFGPTGRIDPGLLQGRNHFTRRSM
jgi:hypothetical protein